MHLFVRLLFMAVCCYAVRWICGMFLSVFSCGCHVASMCDEHHISDKLTRLP